MNEAVPATMRGVYLPGTSSTELRELGVPEPGPGQVLIQVGASGICGSDIGYIYRGYKTHKGVDGPAYRGVVSGHEPSGRIIRTGPDCRRFSAGDRVIVYHIAGCGLCDNCRRGYFISCSAESRASYGWQRDGGNAPYLLAEERTCVPLPDELSYVDGALIACGFGTAYEGLRRVGVSGEGDLLVVGLGPVGLAAGLIGSGMGARTVVGIEPSERRRAWAMETGAFDAVYAPDRLDEAVAGTGGRGFAFAIDASGSAPGRSAALQAAAEWGHVSLVGEGGELTTEVSDTLLHKQLTLHASWVTSLPAMAELARNLVAWGIRPERIVSDRFPLERSDEAFALAAGASRGKVVFQSEGEV
ncbi:zinc-dependent alcohol dehydrogenase family protein [Sediminivirga luteola]|uniref:Oxidoreductase n=1 Tax=Sediminivirga luteola TaxID=1774748 RepID=A0A8J2TVX6_9MICO|nr:zinc-binding dehydrogenase [Sediminivirga luteola]MCI2264418.1 zinc-binding dehydrogenase [Sediminivirga luteola]GGA06044.1 oxidoreductase [Sediminivirga luteola]